MRFLRKTPTRLAAARRDADIHLIVTDTLPGESAAFDVTVDHRAIIGRWNGTLGRGGRVVWKDGRSFRTGDCDLDRDLIVAAVRGSIPYPDLEAEDDGLLSQLWRHLHASQGAGRSR